jgi:3-methylcrotonyl-CoA carboxylase alpha subunit
MIMFKKILIANRGEIAVRIMATCREMGIQTVAVYSEIDRKARHVLRADEAYEIGPAPSAQSYLNMQAIIEAAQRSGSEAIHPGYGFLAENAAFAEACEGAGLVFIGPSAATMRLMGSKIAAKHLAQSVGVPTIPGYNGEDQSDAVLLREGEQIGFPLLIKASAGGGGKGMRTVYTLGEFPEQLTGARREARAAFADETVFLERLLLRPRHLEIQVLGDRYGHLLHLGERECSIQRRHQKIIEESPSPALTPELRAAMGEAAIRIAEAANYTGAGTVEFMLDESDHFYFLEMNTRLQVEHPVTELVTGLDLVRQQLLIAAGEPLTLTQERVKQHGHALEVRIYAEDPQQNFLPSTGTIARFIRPEGPGIRIDSGIADGDEITPFYDPMIAKLIVHSETRTTAIERLKRALQECTVFGITTNLSLLHAICIHPAFQDGSLHTGFLDEHTLQTLPLPAELPSEVLIAAALYTLEQENTPASRTQQTPPFFNPWKSLGTWRMAGVARTFTYRYLQQEYRLALTPTVNNSWTIQTDMQTSEHITCTIEDESLVILRQGPHQRRLSVYAQHDSIQVALDGHIYRLQRRQPPDIADTAHGSRAAHAQKTLTAPMAGTLIKIQVQVGEEVEAHQVLAILSAMKMEHAITAPYAGRIQRISYQEGAVVPGGAVLLELE